MKTLKLRKLIPQILFFIPAMLLLNACSKKVYFPTSPVAPAARGYVKVKKDNNKNYTIEIKVSDLAEVERLQGNSNTYVVWITAANENAKNIGQIKSDTKRFSKALSATFHSVSSVKPIKVFITAEQDGTVQYPGNFVVLSTEIR